MQRRIFSLGCPKFHPPIRLLSGHTHTMKAVFGGIPCFVVLVFLLRLYC